MNHIVRLILKQTSVLAFFAAVTVLMTWPLVLHMGDSILGGFGDNVYFIWLVRWYQGVFFEGKGQPFFNPLMNYPQGWHLSTTDTTLASALPGSLASLFAGPIAGYNFAMLLTFVLSGWFMYGWVRYLTKSDAAGLLAGAMFAFMPYRMAHFLIGHLNLSGTQWIPLYFWGLSSLLRGDERRRWLPPALTALGLGMIAFTSMYYLYMTLLISVVFLLSYLLFAGLQVLRRRIFWIQTAAAAALVLPVLFLALRPFMQLSAQGTISDRSLEYAAQYAASPTDFILPSTDHFLVGRWVGVFFNRDLWPEATLYAGATALALGAVALARRRRTGHPALIAAGMCVILTAFVLALGPYLKWDAEQIVVRVPKFLQGFAGGSESPVYLPAYWLFNHLPFYAKMRAMARFGLFTLVFIFLLAGLGTAFLLEHISPRRRWLAAAVLLALVVFEFYPGSYRESIHPLEFRPVDEWLARQPGNGAVVQFPFEQCEDQLQTYYTLKHGKPFVGGFFNANKPLQYQEIRPVLEQFPSDPAAVEVLRNLQVEYLVVDTAAYPEFPPVERQIEDLGFTLLTDQAGQRVYGFAQP